MRVLVIILLAIGFASPLLAQIGLPPAPRLLGGVLGTVDQTVDRTVNGVQGLDVGAPVRSVRELARDRLARLAAFVRANRTTVEMDDLGEPARRGVILLVDSDAASIDIAHRLGFAAHPADGLDALGLSATELEVPAGVSLAEALKRLRAALPGKTLSADVLHFPAGAANGVTGRAMAGTSAAIHTSVGVIDGRVGEAIPVEARRAFATGAPLPSDHGTAVASLLRDAGVQRIIAADVYGRDPAGGSALAIARALAWLAEEKVRVVSMSLVGPRNPLLERAVAAMAARGTILVAPVGNDGPAAAPAYPASYPSVIAVTAVDRRDRALVEAGKALHLDYAAPGADIKALDAKGRDRSVRGTSFAVPLVAARAAAALDESGNSGGVRSALDAEALDLGRKGADESYGRGLLCERCPRR